MGKITIIDTGYYTSDREGGVSGNSITSLGTYRANSGSAITLNCPRIRLRSGTVVSDEPNPSSNDAARVHYNTFKNRIFEIDFAINVTDSSERNLMKEIAVLERTVGLKLVYNADTSDTIKTIPEIIGRTDTRFNGNEVSSTIPVIVGRVIGLNVDDVGNSRKYAIMGTITFEEEKV